MIRTHRTLFLFCSPFEEEADDEEQ